MAGRGSPPPSTSASTLVTVLPRLLAAAPLLVAAALGAQPSPAKNPGTIEGSASLG